MKKCSVWFFCCVMLVGCVEFADEFEVGPENWETRKTSIDLTDSTLTFGSTYLAVYSEIYERNQQRTYKLTATISIRNITENQGLTLTRAVYFNTKGDPVKTYFDHPVTVAPMETVEIVIDQEEVDGGTGGNFIFDWAVPNNGPEPFFEAVMISASGQQGISFSSKGVRIK